MHTNKSRPFAVPNYVLLLQAKIMAYFKFPLLFRKKSYCANASILCLLPALLHWWRMQASSPRYEHPAEAVGPPGIEDLVRHLAEVADRKQQLSAVSANDYAILKKRNPCQGGSLTDMCCTENHLSSPPPEYHPEKFAVVRSTWLLRATERVNFRIKT